MDIEVPAPHEVLDLAMGDGAMIRIRRHGRAGGVRLFVSHGNGFAVDGYYPFWGPLTENCAGHSHLVAVSTIVDFHHVGGESRSCLAGR